MPDVVPSLYISKEAARQVRQGFPWVYQNELQSSAVLETLAPGQVVAVCDMRGEKIGLGYCNPHSVLAVRLFPGNPAQVDKGYFTYLFKEALRKREQWFKTPYYRLVHSEGDGLPGLVIDRFGAVLVCQVSTLGMECLQPVWQPALQEVVGYEGIIFRNDTPARSKEGLKTSVSVEGKIPPMPVVVHEENRRYYADLLTGQKTGWFYDQRANRSHVASLAEGKTMVDIYTHTGGFGIPAALAGASEVVMVDASASALALAAQAAALNGVEGRCTQVEADVFALLPRWTEEGKVFDVVMADPPAFIKHKQALYSGLEGYRKLARLCAQITAKGGILFMASCSHHASPQAFRKAVEKGIRETGRNLTLLRSAGADKDHPIHAMLPQNAYLKALTYRLD